MTYTSAANLHVTDDAEINFATPNENFGKLGAMKIRSSASGERQMFVRFNLTPISEGASINKATLRLFVKSVTDAGFMDVFLVNESWDEATIKGNNAPALGSMILTGPLQIKKNDAGKWVTFDLTAIVVQDWLDGTSNNFGLAIVPNNSESVKVTFGTKECGTTSHYSEIEVELAGGPAGPTGATGATGATGSAGGLIDFAEFFALMPGDNAATVAVGGDVDFPQNGPTSVGGITRIGVDTFNLTDIGIYQVLFQVSVDEPGQLVVTLNGTVQAATVAGRATGTSQIAGMAFVETTAANSVLTVRNPAGNSSALTITPIAGGASAVSAHLVITRIQ